MDLILQLELLGRLGLAALLGFLVGVERELSGHAAGQRTHALAALGAATFAVISIYAFPGADTARVAAQVVTGLGFLGAGMILKERQQEIHGLTTAAGIWAIGAVGLAVGAGMIVLGVFGAAVIWLLLASERLFGLSRRVAGLRRPRRAGPRVQGDEGDVPSD